MITHRTSTRTGVPVLQGLSAMATDACGPDDCSPALDSRLSLIYGTLSYAP
ncbi:hypothetical protein ACQEWB_21955 [Streptomyces sp. CA-249302]|uniref:hypothetical protein n=1 Tax=Streptomyces sp. CA-249302 TaxID=3240058 RepID=UPI003D8DBBA2